MEQWPGHDFYCRYALQFSRHVSLCFIFKTNPSVRVLFVRFSLCYSGSIAVSGVALGLGICWRVRRRTRHTSAASTIPCVARPKAKTSDPDLSEFTPIPSFQLSLFVYQFFPLLSISTSPFYQETWKLLNLMRRNGSGVRLLPFYPAGPRGCVRSASRRFSPPGKTKASK